MGAVGFSIDEALLAVLKKNLPLDVFLETGTFYGESIHVAKDYFNAVYSIELSEQLYEEACTKYRDYPHIRIMHGDSGRLLKDLVATLHGRPIVYWLDAHWCRTSTSDDCLPSEAYSQCPLLEELKAIEKLDENDIVLIDDARLFLAPPPKPHEISQWPGVDQIIHALLSLSADHALMVLNDYFLFYPRKISAAIQQYAYHQGIDWLTVLDKSRDYDYLSSQLEEKEIEIQKKEQEIQNLKRVCDEREQLIIKFHNRNKFSCKLL